MLNYQRVEHVRGLSSHSRISWPVWRCLHWQNHEILLGSALHVTSLGCRSKYWVFKQTHIPHSVIANYVGHLLSVWLFRLFSIPYSNAQRDRNVFFFFSEFTKIRLVLSFFQVAICPLVIQQKYTRNTPCFIGKKTSNYAWAISNVPWLCQRTRGYGWFRTAPRAPWELLRSLPAWLARWDTSGKSLDLGVSKTGAWTWGPLPIILRGFFER